MFVQRKRKYVGGVVLSAVGAVELARLRRAYDNKRTIVLLAEHRVSHFGKRQAGKLAFGHVSYGERHLTSLLFLYGKFAEFCELLIHGAFLKHDKRAFFHFGMIGLALIVADRTNAGNDSRALHALGKTTDQADHVLVWILFDFYVYG